MIPDVNVLVAASRTDHPQHRAATAWIKTALKECASGATFLLLPMVVASCLRLVTNPKIFPDATPIEDAIGFIDSLMALPEVEMPALGAEWPLLRQACLDKKLSANALPDAWLAAAVVQLGDHLVTFDAGFKNLLRHGQYTLLASA